MKTIGDKAVIPKVRTPHRTPRLSGNRPRFTGRIYTVVYLCSVPTDRDAGECVPGGPLTRHALEGFQRRAAADAQARRG